MLKDRHRAKRLGIVIFLLSNCMTCLRGNQVNSMFDSEHPSLQEYLPLNEEIHPFDLNIEEDDIED